MDTYTVDVGPLAGNRLFRTHAQVNNDNIINNPQVSTACFSEHSAGTDALMIQVQAMISKRTDKLNSQIHLFRRFFRRSSSPRARKMSRRIEPGGMSDGTQIYTDLSVCCENMARRSE